MSLWNTGPTMKLSIVIVSYNTADITRECLRRVFQHGQGLDMEVIVVDNASRDDSYAMVAREFPQVILLKTETNLGFAGGNNPGIRVARGRFILLLNSDAYIFADTLGSSLEAMEAHPEWGLLGVKLVGQDGAMQPSARNLPSAWYKFLAMTGLRYRFPQSKILGAPDLSWWDHSEPRVVGWVPGAYLLVRREVFDAVGLLNEERYFLYYEETEFCLKAGRAGFPVVFFPHVQCIHLGGESSKSTGTVTKTGSQLDFIRVQSEFRYYRGNYGLWKVWSAAAVEVVWNAVIWTKNSLGRGDGARGKRDEAAKAISLVFLTLRRDGWGSGLMGPGIPPRP